MERRRHRRTRPRTFMDSKNAIPTALAVDTKAPTALAVHIKTNVRKSRATNALRSKRTSCGASISLLRFVESHCSDTQFYGNFDPNLTTEDVLEWPIPSLGRVLISFDDGTLVWTDEYVIPSFHRDAVPKHRVESKVLLLTLSLSLSLLF